jgi:hypothetical protein
VLTTFFANLQAPQPKDENLGLSLKNTFANLQQFRLSAISSSLSARVSPTKSFITDYLANFSQMLAVATPQIDVSKITGTSATAAQQQLSSAGLMVNIEAYDPSNVAANSYRAAIAPSQVPPGSSVTLVEDSTGTVRYVVPAPDQVQILQTQLTAAQKAQAEAQLTLQNQVASLNTQIVNLQATHLLELETMSQQIAQLGGSLQTVQAAVQKLSIPPPSAKG